MLVKLCKFSQNDKEHTNVKYHFDRPSVPPGETRMEKVMAQATKTRRPWKI
jgi:hypothetical protein